MKKVFTGDLRLVREPDGRRRRDREGRAAHVRARHRRGDPVDGRRPWRIGLFSAVRAGRFADRLLTVLALIGISMPVFWVGALMNHYLGFKARHLSQRGLRGVHDEPARLGLPPDPAVDRPGAAVHRLLLARAALERARHDERGLRAHRAGQGAVRAPDPDPPRAAQLDDPDHHACGGSTSAP